mmetsp:Transcript_15055/g.40378  ORF Transcript_15055/g.40378 Transcript_15055/m.40378 type:complete len:361 (+) Transcript_15055:39-1121(+)
MSEETVCVTGATGYVAAWIVKELLDAGFAVNATVRDKSREEKVAPLLALPHAAARLSLFELDVNGPDAAFDDAIRECSYVIHTASPVLVGTKEAQKALFDPAMNGTLGVLRSCKRVGGNTLKRVVLTSSISAIGGQGSDGRVLTENDWNSTSTLDYIPYAYAKTCAEQAAWKFMSDEKPAFDLCALHPSLCVGPPLNPKFVPPSVTESVLAAVDGKVPIVLSFLFHFVDVRDVAIAHRKAMLSDKASGQRFICHNVDVHSREYADFVIGLGYSTANGYPTARVDLSGSVGTAFLWYMSYMMGEVGSMLRTELGNPMLLDNSKIKRELGVEFRPWQDSIRETLEYLTANGHLKPLPSADSA